MSEQEEELRRQIVLHIHAEDELAKARRFIGALLAVARDAQWSDDECGSLDSAHRLGQTLNALAVAWPDWKEWKP